MREVWAEGNRVCLGPFAVPTSAVETAPYRRKTDCSVGSLSRFRIVRFLHQFAHMGVKGNSNYEEHLDLTNPRNPSPQTTTPFSLSPRIASCHAALSRAIPPATHPPGCRSSDWPALSQ